jgi:Fe-S cluster biogenesis protein NfuA
MLPDESVLRAVVETLDREIRPFVQSHGGDVLVDSVQDGHVFVRFVAACIGCGLRPVTFGGTVRPRLLQLPGVVAVSCEGVELSSARLDAIAAFTRG